MLRTSRVFFLAAVSAAGACSVTQDPGYTGRPRRTDQASSMGRWGDRIVLEADAIPAAWIWIDTDGGQPDPGQQYAAGYAVRAATGDLDQSVGLQYQGFFLDDIDVDISVLSLDVHARTPLDQGPHQFYVHAGGGIGWSWIDDPIDGSVRSDAQAQLRVGIDFQATETLAITTSLGGIFFGHPGETEAYGAFLTVGAMLVF